MKIFFDTEFYEDGKTIDLMSIGMVREDGDQLYLVNKDCDWRKPFNDDWHISNTLPTILPYITGPQALTREQIARRVCDFCKHPLRKHVGTDGTWQDDPPEFWAYSADYDWVVLCQLFGRMIDLPEGWPMYCRDFKQLCDLLNHKPAKQKKGNHNALEDALWLAKEYEALYSSKL